VFGDDPQRKSFVCQLVDRLRAGDTFDVPSDQLITPTYGPSLARAVVKLAEQGRTGLFHIAGPDVLGRVEFALLVTDAFALDPGLLRPRPTTELGLIAKRPERAGLRTEKLPSGTRRQAHRAEGSATRAHDLSTRPSTAVCRSPTLLPELGVRASCPSDASTPRGGRRRAGLPARALERLALEYGVRPM